MFYFLLPFALVSIPSLYVTASQKPSYLSEGTILLEAQTITPEIVRPIITAKSNDRIESFLQRVTTRETLLSIANKFGLFPNNSPSDVVDKMRKGLAIKPAEFDGQPKGAPTIAFKIGFEYGNPELAMRVANELVTLIIGEDTRTRTSQATEAVKMLAGQAKDIENKIESTQKQVLEIARRPRVGMDEGEQQESSALKDLAAARAELAQKSAVYSDAHPVVVALKKRVAAMEKTITQPSRAQTQSQSRAAELDALKRQAEVLETRLAEANSRLASALLGENQERPMEIIERPSLPQRPIIAKRLKIVGMLFAAAAILGIGAAIGSELLDGSIRTRGQLTGVVDNSLVVCIPYIATRAEIIRSRLRIIFGIVGIAITLSAWGSLTTAIVLGLRVDLMLEQAGI
jgi:uncharacterized protein involved in exopolysaccharide biosynthesis